MQQIVLVIHLLIALGLVGLVLIQRSEGGGLGMGGGGGGGGGGMMSVRGTASFLTRATGVLAACFMATSILLAILAGSGTESTSILDQPAPAATESAPAEQDGLTTPLSE